MPAKLRLIVPFICFLVISTTSWSMQLNVQMANIAPTIDGTVSPEEQAATTGPLELVRAGGLDKPSQSTKVFVWATLKGLYVGFIASESTMGSLVTSTTVENGPVFNDDSVQVLITPKLDTAADDYYHFVLNPNGVRYSNYLLTGDVITNWKSAVKKGPDGWQAEFFIPLESIKAPYELPHWRANFARHRPAHGDSPEESSAWMNPGSTIHNYKRFGYLSMPRFVPAAPGAAEYTTSTVEVFTPTTSTR